MAQSFCRSGAFHDWVFSLSSCKNQSFFVPSRAGSVTIARTICSMTDVYRITCYNIILAAMARMCLPSIFHTLIWAVCAALAVASASGIIDPIISRKSSSKLSNLPWDYVVQSFYLSFLFLYRRCAMGLWSTNTKLKFYVEEIKFGGFIEWCIIKTTASFLAVKLPGTQLNLRNYPNISASYKSKLH